MKKILEVAQIGGEGPKWQVKKLEDENIQNWQPNSDWPKVSLVKIFLFEVKKYKFGQVKT